MLALASVVSDAVRTTAGLSVRVNVRDAVATSSSGVGLAEAVSVKLSEAEAVVVGPMQLSATVHGAAYHAPVKYLAVFPELTNDRRWPVESGMASYDEAGKPDTNSEDEIDPVTEPATFQITSAS